MQYIISIIPILNTLLTVTPSIIPNNKQNIKIKGEGEGPPNMQIQIENNTVNGDGPERINMNVNIINSQNIQNIQNENIINSQNIQNIQNENIITMNPLKINIITECTQTIREILSIESTHQLMTSLTVV